MDSEYRAGRLHADGVDLQALAEAVGTPCYVYSRACIETRWRAYDRALADRDHRICYAVKANHNLAILGLLARLGSGFDIVSLGELERALAAGASPGELVFSGVAKTQAEIRRALEVGVGCINVESRAECERVAEVAQGVGRPAPVAVRVNPDVDAGTHPYIATGLRTSKFGVAPAEAMEIYRAVARDSRLLAQGIACHIGSQLLAVEPVVDAVRAIVRIARELEREGISLRHIDVGGGLGVRYHDEAPPDIAAFAAAVAAEVPARYAIVMEPGRSIVAAAGMLLTRVEYVKRGADRAFVIVDAAMNDFLRPTLYDAWHDVVALVARDGRARELCDVVGPVCESGDWLARGRELAVAPGEVLAITGAGAYGAVMASNYNARPRPPEVLLDGGGGYRVVRSRETLEHMLHDERSHLEE